jgi:hypothetical protein
MSNKPEKEIKPAKNKVKKNINFKNFKVDFDLNLNKTFNTTDVLKKEFKILTSEELKITNKKTKKNNSI